MHNILVSYPVGTPTSPQPKLVVISSNGLTDASHDSLPFLLKPLYSYGLRGPHADKLIMERESNLLKFRTYVYSPVILVLSRCYLPRFKLDMARK